MKAKIAVIQIYIHWMKGKEVDIFIPTHPFRILKLEKAYNKAVLWMQSVNVKISTI